MCEIHSNIDDAILVSLISTLNIFTATLVSKTVDFINTFESVLADPLVSLLPTLSMIPYFSSIRRGRSIALEVV